MTASQKSYAKVPQECASCTRCKKPYLRDFEFLCRERWSASVVPVIPILPRDLEGTSILRKDKRCRRPGTARELACAPPARPVCARPNPQQCSRVARTATTSQLSPPGLCKPARMPKGRKMILLDRRKHCLLQLLPAEEATSTV